MACCEQLRCSVVPVLNACYDINLNSRASLAISTSVVKLGIGTTRRSLMFLSNGGSSLTL